MGGTHRTRFPSKQPREDQDPGRPSLGHRDRRAWKTYATIGMGVTDNIERLRAAFIQRSSRRLEARREERGRNLETAVPLVVQTKRD